MIITYAYETESNVYNRMLFVPDGMPWKLTAEVESIVEGTNENPDDFQTDYVLKLIVGSGLEELIMNSESLWGLFPKELEEEDVLDFFNTVIDEAAIDLALTLKEGKCVYDLFETITRVMNDYTLRMTKAEEKGSK